MSASAPPATSNELLTLLRISLCPALVAALCSGTSVVSSAAQTLDGELRGRVLDATGAAVPDSRVDAVCPSRGVVATTTADRQGLFAFPSLPPCEYEVLATAPGFKKTSRRGLKLGVRESITSDLVLEIGPIDQQVTVEGDAPPLNQAASGLGFSLGSQFLQVLPLRQRSTYAAALVLPGVVPSAEGSQNSTNGGAVSVNGAREQANAFLLDGIDNTNPGFNQMSIRPSFDAVDELRIHTSSYEAEFGRAGGAQFLHATRAGINAWSSASYVYYADEAFNARNPFEARDRPQASADYYQIGIRVGGPIRRDRLFVFGHFETTRTRAQSVRLASVPPMSWRRGDFSALLTGRLNADGLDEGQLFDPRTRRPLVGNIIPPELQDPAGVAILSFYPVPDDADAEIPSTALVAPMGAERLRQATGRLDAMLGASRLFGRISWWTQRRDDPFDPLVTPTNVPGFGSSSLNDAINGMISWSRIHRSRMAMEVRGGVNQVRNALFHEHQGNDVSAAIGITGLPQDPKDVGRPGVILGVTDDLMEPFNAPQDGTATTAQLAGVIGWMAGSYHTLKAGVETRVVRSDLYFDLYARGQFVFAGLSGNPVADLLMGAPLLALRQDPTKNTQTDFRTFGVSAFAQDTWRVTSGLTANLGIRYDFNAPPYDRLDRLSVPRLADPEGGFLAVGREGVSRAGYASDYNNVAPRLAVSWHPSPSSPVVVRAGYGVFYDFPIQNMNLLPRFNPPQYGLDLAVRPPGLRNAFESRTVPATQIFGVDPELRDAFYEHRNVTAQLQAAKKTLLEVGYVGSTGTNLIRWSDPNQGPAGGPPVINPAFGPARVVASTGRSKYDSLQLRLLAQLGEASFVSTSYTFGHSRDDVSALFGAQNGNTGAPQNSHDLDAEWGPSDFDVRHRFSGAFALALGETIGVRWLAPIQVAGVITLQTGRPFTPNYGESANYSGTSNGSNRGPGVDRPDQVGNPHVEHPTPEQWFDAGAFFPPNGTFGRVGRNSLRGPGHTQLDLAIAYSRPLGNGMKLAFKTEVFNALNTTNFYLPVADLSSAVAGRILRAYPARELVFSFRLELGGGG